MHAFKGRENESIYISYVFLVWADGKIKQMKLLKIKGIINLS
jgi:hypothetical protein